jgi:peptidoglycan/LPS O-acetylase OafA/YrhL
MPGEALTNNSWRIPGLDGLRAIAVLFVLIGHGAYSFPIALGAAFPFLGNGALGVNIFFVLSGYLIYELSAREYEKTGRFDWRQFYLRRILRIFPCFYSYIAVVAILMALGVLVLTPSMMVAVTTFSLNYRHLWDHTTVSDNYLVICHYWTLALEEQFYLTWPLLMFLLARRRLLTVMGVVILLAPFVRVFCYFFTPGSREQIGMMFHTGFDSIAMGVFLGELLRRQNWKTRLQALAGKRWVLACAIIFLVMVSPALTARFRGGYSITIGKTLELACIALVIVANVSFSSRTLSLILNWRPLAFIGVLSYSLYVWNPLFLDVETNWIINRFPLNYIALFLAAAGSYSLIERPLLRLKDHLRGRRKATRIDLSPSISAAGEGQHVS